VTENRGGAKGDLPSEPLSAVVLCGGVSRRMGTDKAFLEFEGRPLISRVLGALRTISDDVAIVSGREGVYDGLGAKVVPDLRPGCGPLGGIGGGLRAVEHELAAVVACDMPFLNPDFLRLLAARAEGLDGAVPMKGRQFEPLHAVYRRSCLPAIERRLDAADFQVFHFYPEVRIRSVAEREWRPLDPEGLSLVNINSAEEYERLRRPGRKT
jgi:molybdopterin-guanine dinucleotide biosynthesis protein A